MILSPSETLVRALIDQTTSEVILWLFTIEHVDTGSVYYLTNNLESIVSNGCTFDPFPVDFVLPPDDGETVPEVKIVLMSAEKELIDLVRRYSGGITVTAQLVLASNPDSIEFTIDDLEILSAHYDKKQVEMLAKPEAHIEQRFPADDYLPRTFPGMFK